MNRGAMIMIGLGTVVAVVVGSILVQDGPIRRRKIIKRPAIDGQGSIVDVARAELTKWDGLTDTDEAGSALVDYYFAHGIGMSDEEANELPWSGAFIAYVANAAIPKSLARFGMHTAYARAQLANSDPNRYTTFLGSLPVKVGDIIIKPRPGRSATFSDLHNGNFESHGDIVTDVRATEITAIGGNKVGHRVAEEIYPRNHDGSVPGLIAVLRLARDYPQVVVNPPGYRRAKNIEVTEEMRLEAADLLKYYALGEIAYTPEYAIGFETHDNDDGRGPHKGASIFVPRGES